MPESIRVTFLGGLGEIGRNCLAIEQDGRIVVVDAGLMFPEPTMYGVDLILPDFRWLIERKDRVDAIVLLSLIHIYPGSSPTTTWPRSPVTPACSR